MPPIANTRYGQLQGVEEDGLAVFRGVPFAAPPLGELRFRAPRPPEAWDGVRDATEFASISMQTFTPGIELLGAWEAPVDEDCLSLNVWTPGLDDAARPVMVWIHGGGFSGGSGSTPIYDGRHLAQRGDVVVVTINYRLGALGYFYNPRSPTATIRRAATTGCATRSRRWSGYATTSPASAAIRTT